MPHTVPRSTARTEAHALSAARRVRMRGVAEPLLIGALLLLAVPIAVIKSHSYRVYGGYVEKVDVQSFRTPRERLAIVNVSVLSPDGERMLEDQTVIVDDGKILSIGPSSPSLDGMTVINGRGQFLVPGLIDAHVHLRNQPNDLLLYLANGITTVRDLAGSPNDLAWRDAVRKGRPGPDLYVTSPMLFSSGWLSGAFNEFTQPRMRVRDAEDAAKVVETLQKQGYDAIKTYADLDFAAFEAINREARSAGMHTVGHLPDGYDLATLSTTNQREIAHIEELIKALQDEFRREDLSPFAEHFPDFVSSRADAIVADLLARDITVNTTLWLMENVERQLFDLRAALGEIPLEYANPAMVEGSPYVGAMGWLPGRNQFEIKDDITPEKRSQLEGAWRARAEAHRRLFQRMVTAGVRLVAGTDATSHLVIPGFSLHDELAVLVNNGMTPSAALKAATRLPGELMQRNVGVITPGYRADLLLLDENPLLSIGHTRRINAVIADGRLYRRDTLDQMLTAVAAAHAESRNFDLNAFPATTPSQYIVQ